MDMYTSDMISPPIRVLVVDDHDVSRQGLVLGMERHSDLRLVGQASSGASAIRRVEELDGAVDVIVMDAQMATPTDGVEAAATLHAKWPECRILLLTSSERHAVAARRAGVMGYVLKGSRLQDVLAAIRAVHRGVLHFEVVPEDKAVLTDAEVKILNLVGDGLSNAQIGDQLGWSPRAVAAHISNIIRKLGAVSREQAVRFGVRQGIIH